MKDRVFLDTNVLVYAKLETEDDREKRDMAIALIHQLKIINPFHVSHP